LWTISPQSRKQRLGEDCLSHQKVCPAIVVTLFVSLKQDVNKPFFKVCIIILHGIVALNRQTQNSVCNLILSTDLSTNGQVKVRQKRAAIFARDS
jgi:hypothetical protein